MKRRSRALLLLAASAALVVGHGTASAEEDAGVHVRGYGIAEAGPLIMPGFLTLGVLGAQLAAGVQLGKPVALYAAGNIDLVIGSRRGMSGGLGVLVDFKLGDTIRIGGGPELGYLTVYGTLTEPTWGRYQKGFLPAGRVRLAWLAGIVGGDGDRGQGLIFGLDVRLLHPMAGFFVEPRTARPILVAPMLTFGLAVW